MNIETLIAQNRLKEAQNLLLNELDKNPNNTANLSLLGQIAMKNQDYSKALNAFNKILSMDPTNHEAIAFISTIRGILSISNSFYFENTYLDDSLYE